MKIFKLTLLLLASLLFMFCNGIDFRSKDEKTRDSLRIVNDSLRTRLDSINREEESSKFIQDVDSTLFYYGKAQDFQGKAEINAYKFRSTGEEKYRHFALKYLERAKYYSDKGKAICKKHTTTK